MKSLRSAVAAVAGVSAVVALSACGATSPAASPPPTSSSVTTVVSAPSKSTLAAPSTAPAAAGVETPSSTATAASSVAGVASTSAVAPQPTAPATPASGGSNGTGSTTAEPGSVAPDSPDLGPVSSSAPTAVSAAGATTSTGAFVATNTATGLPKLGANRLYVPSLRINTSILAAPVKSGTLVVPASTKVGRWTGSASYTAATGRVVIAGHTLSYGSYRGALAPIARATNGTVIYVSDSAGKVYRFKVSSRQQMAKSSLPADVFYGRDSLKLKLITCGGVVLRDGHHKDNVVVTAVRY